MSAWANDILKSFVPRPIDAWYFDVPAARRQLEYQVENYPAFVLPDAEKPVALCGIVYSCNVGSVWMITGVGFERKAPLIVKQLRVLCETAWDALALHRLQMFVDSADDKAKLFARKLGFLCEAENLKKMGARGQDLDIYRFERDKS